MRRAAHFAVVVFLAVLLTPLLLTRAFVPGYTSSGALTRWDLSGTNTSVHTNVVNRSTRAIRFFLASDGYSTTNTAAELNALRASFGQWQSVPGTGLKFEDAGLVAPGVDVNTSDNTNVLYWVKSSTTVNGGRDNISGALGVTFTSIFSDGSFAEADIVFNGVQFQWFTDFSDTNNMNYFIEGVALHEMGHFLGLDHSPLGGAIMLARGSTGVKSLDGLSPDETAFARWLYPPTPAATNWAMLKGTVTKAGSPVFGASVIVENTSGNVIGSAVTSANAGPQGSYQIPLPAPGTYIDISGDYGSADANFLATTNTSVTLSAGTTNTLDFAVANVTPSFRVSRIRTPTSDPFSYGLVNSPAALRAGQSNFTVGVYSPDFTSGMTLMIPGDGLTVGATTFESQVFTGFNLLSVPISVSSNATPGMRSFVVQTGTNIAYENGFLKILPAMPDFNFDGLDDAFQRKYFPVFTATNAAPGADQDGDGFTNQAEYIAGTVPTNAASLLRIESVRQDAGGCTITWQSGAGHRYQVFSKPLVAGTFTTVGSPVTASGSVTTFTDTSATSGIKFYRVQALP
ncbi:MAG: matrixin family metalloprotease [Verrucomicrobia bacterium]|nr:matrixin family metalloprotease [Verrucomicrobiota bacterium]